MKVKLEFVTNSSSTSFVIADYRKDADKVLVEYDWGTIDLLKALRSEKMEDYEDFEYNHHEDEQVKEAFEKGATVYILHADDNGRGILEAGFCRCGIEDAKVPEGVVVIKGEGGY